MGIEDENFFSLSLFLPHSLSFLFDKKKDITNPYISPNGALDSRRGFIVLSKSTLVKSK